ncbi:MAG: ABC transporter ATP-binding protein [Chryseolinea sp.]
MSDDVVISVRGVSKQYRIGTKEKRADTFFGALKNFVVTPFRNYKQIRNLTRNNENDETLFWALRDVNFEVKQGEALGIIGHNGAGKSTLLKILSRITDPTEGEIMIKGRVSALLEVGTGFHPELTGRENVYMNGTILGMTKKDIDQKFDEIVEFSGIIKHIDTPVKFYSSGMKVRLAFAVAAHLEPELLIIDEVLAVGDAEFQKKCLGKMEDVSKNGRTVLFVSHNLTAVQNLCQNCLVLKNGAVIFVGNTHDAIQLYLGEHSNQRMELVANGEPEFENDKIKFISARIVNANRIETTDDIHFEFSFEYKGIDSPIIDVTYHLYDELNTLVFVGSSGYELNIRPTQKSLTFHCTIPGDLLYEGNYKMARLIFVQDKGYLLLNINDALSFDIIPSGKENFGWMGKKQGVVKPKLKWSALNDTRN